MGWRSALVIAACLAAIAAPWPSVAQVNEAALRSLDWAPDPLERSPRLLGMGRLTLAADLHNRLSLWEFAGNPTGLAEAESVTTFEYRPVVRHSSVLHDLTEGSPRERQELSATQLRQVIETWRRQPGSAAYGAVAELASLQVDRPYAAGVERRGRFRVPAIGGAVNGRMPWLKSDRFDFAMRLEYRLEFQDDDYFEFLRLPQGEYLGQESPIVPPPDLFSPDRVEISGVRGGAGVSMRVTRDIKAAIGYDRAKIKVRSSQIGLRSTSKIDEDRPFDIGQASLVGRLGRNLEWVADGRAWRSASEEFFFWTISAGQTQAPLSGSGKRLDRDERGTSLRARVRWLSGPLEVGASFGTSFRRETVTPWFPRNPGDKAGFNDFLGEVGTRVNADTLILPPRVVATEVDERGYEVAGGVSWHLSGGRGVVGAEAHRRQGSRDLSLVPRGPEPSGWDVRAGAEYRCNAALLARAGGGFGIDDGDDLTADNERRNAIATAGFGHQPVGSRWSVDAGYAHEWVRSDYADPLHTRGSHHHLALQMRWQF
jgi:hypothetical protein